MACLIQDANILRGKATNTKAPALQRHPQNKISAPEIGCIYTVAGLYSTQAWDSCLSLS